MPDRVEVEAFPFGTDATEKIVRDEREHDFADEDYSKEEIRSIRKSREKLKQEEHHDDCGSDVTPLMDSEHLCHLSCSETVDDASEASFFESM